MNAPAWLQFLKMLFGFCLLTVLGLLARGLALNQVKADTSYGLEIILGGLLTMSGAFANWAFGEVSHRLEQTPKPEETSKGTP